MKKVIIIAIVAFLFYHAVMRLNAYLDEGMFSDYQNSEFVVYEPEETDEPSLWDKVTKEVKTWFEEEEEHFIYR